MWIITKHGFVSIVQSRNDPDTMLIRARNPQHLHDNFIEFSDDIFEDPTADYRWRLEVPYEAVGRMLYNAAREIDYDSHVKEAVSQGDDDFYRAMMRMWNAHADYQEAVVARLEGRVPASTSAHQEPLTDAEFDLSADEDDETCVDCGNELTEDEMTGELFCPVCDEEGEPDRDAVTDAVAKS